jgi:hypothetical protein
MKLQKAIIFVSFNLYLYDNIYNRICVNSNKDKTVSIHAVLKDCNNALFYMDTFSIKSKVAEITQFCNNN